MNQEVGAAAIWNCRSMADATTLKLFPSGSVTLHHKSSPLGPKTKFISSFKEEAL